MRHHLHKNRQDSEPPPVPSTVSGLSNSAATVGTEAATDSQLAIDPSAAHTSISIATQSQTLPITTPVPEPSPSNEPPPSSSSSTKTISIGTVIAACVGALVGAVVLVLIALWLYRRSGTKSRKTRSPHSPLHASRSARGEFDRSRSRQERWNKLDDNQGDMWETQFPTRVQTKEVEHTNLPPMEKLTMFKSSPSLHSVDKSSSSSHQSNGMVDHFSAYDRQEAPPLPRELLGRAEPGQPPSWDSGSYGNDSIMLSVRSKEFLPSGTVSALRTPPATSHHQSYRWETAEVMHVDDQHGLADDVLTRERRTSFSNPFFGASQDSVKGRTRSRSGSHTRSRTSSTVSESPFSRAPVPQLPKASRPLSDESGTYDANRAIQSLIAALDATPDGARTVSVQSTASTATSEDRVESFSAFPLPPDDVPPIR